MFAFASNFQKTMLQNVFQFRSPFRKYSPHLVAHSTWMNLGLPQIITVILLIATIIGTCQRVSRSNLKIKPKYYALTLKPRIKFPPKIKLKSDILTHLYLSRLIALSGDIHPNPGPYGRPICPCGSCHQPVRNRDKAILCEECNQWHHIHCIGISQSSYNSLINQSAFWLCDHCGIPNITTSPSRNEQSNSTNTWSDSSMLSTPTLHTSQNAGLIFVPNPQNTSTPERHMKTQGNTFKGILINTNSVKSIEKATQLKATIQYNNPDIIFLVETKLDANYATYSFLPPNYEAIRKDRSVHGGGVLIAFRNSIVAEPLQNLGKKKNSLCTKQMHILCIVLSTPK